MPYTYLKANKVNAKHEISPDEDGNWYRVIENQSVKIPGQRAHRVIDCAQPTGSGFTTFTFDSGEEVRCRLAA